MKTLTIASNPVVAKLIDADRKVKLMVSEWISYQVEAANFMPKASTRTGWDGRSTFFKFKTSSFPAGFVPKIIRNLERHGYRVAHIQKDAPLPLGPEDPVVDGFPEDPRYDYQRETVRRLVRHRRMVAQIATGGGKSRVARLAYARIGRPTLFVTTRSVLMYQMKDNFEEMLKQRVGVMGDGQWSPCKGFNVAMVQTLAQRLEVKTIESEMESHVERERNAEMREMEKLKSKLAKRGASAKERVAAIHKLQDELAAKRRPDADVAAEIADKVKEHNERRELTKRILSKFELVILEEAHEAGGNSYYSVMNACVNAHYRLALTGTPFMRADAEDNLRLMGCVGPVGIKVTEKELIDKGILARPIFMFAPTVRPKKLFKTTPYSKAYISGIVDNDWRNGQTVSHCVSMAEYGLTTMVLVQRKAHGEELLKRLKKAGLKAEFIYGDNKQDERNAALARLGNNEIDVLLGTNIMDVGVDVPSVGSVVKAGGGKAEVADRQRIGRGLRAKKSGPNVCFVLDFRDEHNDHLRSHAMARRAIVNNTPGFAENVLGNGQSFDLESLGFKKVRSLHGSSKR